MFCYHGINFMAFYEWFQFRPIVIAADRVCECKQKYHKIMIIKSCLCNLWRQTKNNTRGLHQSNDIKNFCINRRFIKFTDKRHMTKTHNNLYVFFFVSTFHMVALEFSSYIKLMCTTVSCVNWRISTEIRIKKNENRNPIDKSADLEISYFPQ